MILVVRTKEGISAPSLTSSKYTFASAIAAPPYSNILLFPLISNPDVADEFYPFIFLVGPGRFRDDKQHAAQPAGPLIHVHNRGHSGDDVAWANAHWIVGCL